MDLFALPRSGLLFWHYEGLLFDTVHPGGDHGIESALGLVFMLKERVDLSLLPLGAQLFAELVELRFAELGLAQPVVEEVGRGHFGSSDLFARRPAERDILFLQDLVHRVHKPALVAKLESELV